MRNGKRPGRLGLLCPVPTTAMYGQKCLVIRWSEDRASVAQNLLSRISILNLVPKSSDRRRHQYSCGFERDEDTPEVSTQWVRYKTSPFSSPSTALSRLISKAPASL